MAGGGGVTSYFIGFFFSTPFTLEFEIPQHLDFSIGQHLQILTNGHAQLFLRVFKTKRGRRRSVGWSNMTHHFIQAVVVGVLLQNARKQRRGQVRERYRNSGRYLPVDKLRLCKIWRVFLCHTHSALSTNSTPPLSLLFHPPPPKPPLSLTNHLVRELSSHLTVINPRPFRAFSQALRNRCSSMSVHCTLNSSHFFVRYSCLNCCCKACISESSRGSPLPL